MPNPQSYHDEMKIAVIQLIESFPVMKGRIPDLCEWDWDYIKDPARLPETYKCLSTSQQAIIDFALQVWDYRRDWTVEGYQQFNVVRAFDCWDRATQRVAFLQWANNPFCR